MSLGVVVFLGSPPRRWILIPGLFSVRNRGFPVSMGPVSPNDWTSIVPLELDRLTGCVQVLFLAWLNLVLRSDWTVTTPSTHVQCQGHLPLLFHFLPFVCNVCIWDRKVGGTNCLHLSVVFRTCGRLHRRTIAGWWSIERAVVLGDGGFGATVSKDYPFWGWTFVLIDTLQSVWLLSGLPQSLFDSNTNFSVDVRKYCSSTRWPVPDHFGFVIVLLLLLWGWHRCRERKCLRWVQLAGWPRLLAPQYGWDMLR